MNANTISCRPLRIDVLLVTANKYERNAANNVFDFRYSYIESKLFYVWGELPRQEKNEPPITVAMIYLKDSTGSGQASVSVGDAIPILRPSCLIDVGIAAGAETKEMPVALGDIVIASLVHHGAIGKNNELRDGRAIQQPSALLLSTAESVTINQKWRNELDFDLAPDDEPQPIVDCRFTELVSADAMANRGTDYVKGNIEKFPRAGAFEMEAGAIAHVLHHNSDDLHTPSFLFVKAVSDMVLENGKIYEIPEPELDQNAQRVAWRQFAASAAALFIHELIQNIQTDYLRPAYHDRLWPMKTKTSDIQHQSGNIGVFGNVEPENYSELSDKILQDLSKRNGTAKFFTVCTYSPSALWNIIARSGGKEPQEVDIKDQAEFAENNFKHFGGFLEYSKTYPNCVRILLMDESYPTEKEWELFLILNGNLTPPSKRDGDLESPSKQEPSWEDGVPCWVIKPDDLQLKRRPVRFLTDYVILGEELLLDYYQDSGILCASELMRHHQCKDYYLNLRAYFIETHSQRTSKFIELRAKHSKLQEYFQRGLE